MNNRIFSFIFGSLVKIVDDYYDTGLYNSKIINVVKLLLIGCIFIWCNFGIEYTVGFLVGSLICYYSKQIDQIFYKKAIIF